MKDPENQEYDLTGASDHTNLFEGKSRERTLETLSP